MVHEGIGVYGGWSLVLDFSFDCAVYECSMASKSMGFVEHNTIPMSDNPTDSVSADITTRVYRDASAHFGMFNVALILFPLSRPIPMTSCADKPID
jgi:hypothetical protein